MFNSVRSTALPRFVVVYAAMYAGFGVASPFLPAFVSARGLPPEQLGLVLGIGTAVRILTAPLAAQIGDRTQAVRTVLACCTALAGLTTLAYLPAYGLWSLAAVSIFQAAALAPLTVLADALALSAASAPRGNGRRGFEYGWVRGTGSAGFILGTLLSGRAVGQFGLSMIVWLEALLLGAAAFATTRLPELMHDHSAGPARPAASGVAVLLRLSVLRNLMVVAALILGSHAMHDVFAVIRWRAAGISPVTVSVLWSEAVAAEVIVFFVVGPKVLAHVSPAGALAVAAFAGILRWGVMAQTSAVPFLALVQPLHGITFALAHLACMRVIGRVAPQGLEGTAQALYGTVAIGATTALLSVASGPLYARLGASAFWVMAMLCAIALPFIWRLRH